MVGYYNRLPQIDYEDENWIHMTQKSGLWGNFNKTAAINVGVR